MSFIDHDAVRSQNLAKQGKTGPVAGLDTSKEKNKIIQSKKRSSFKVFFEKCVEMSWHS